MQIPQSDILSTNAMNRVFDTTTATYKKNAFKVGNDIKTKKP